LWVLVHSSISEEPGFRKSKCLYFQFVLPLNPEKEYIIV